MRLFAAARGGSVNSPLVARVVLIVFAAVLLAGCGGEKVVSPTGPVEGTVPKAAKGDAAGGKMVFNDAGCAGCHAFTPAGSKGTLGPNLDEALKGKDAGFIEESIKSPNEEIAKGFQPGVMPQDYGSSLTSKQIADLVAFLQTG